jgi:hypothetical protein
VHFDLQIGGVKAKVTGTGAASIEEGVSGSAGATVGGRIGHTGVEVGVEVGGGTQKETRVGATVTVTPGAPAPEIPNCFKCFCHDPTTAYACVVHDPEIPGKTPPPQSQQILYVPLFFEYERTIPRIGRKKGYTNALDDIVKRLREGYTIARIEGRTSPEGPLTLKKRQKGGFEGNIPLAQSRAEQAQKDLQAALDTAIGTAELQIRDRDTIRRLKDARSANYEVKGLAPDGDPSSAELFGTGVKGEVTERDMLKHLKNTLKAPTKGQTDPLTEEHVIGEGLPPEVRAEVEAEVEVFRTGKRGEKALGERELLETIYKPLRRALIVLNPPPQKAPTLQRTGEEGKRIVGQPIACRPKDEAVFDDIPIPEDWWHEGECKPKGGVGGEVK